MALFKYALTDNLIHEETGSMRVYFLPFFLRSCVSEVFVLGYDMTLYLTPQRMYYIGRVFAVRQFSLLCLPPAALCVCKT
jgi:hypothetical protein